MIAFITIAIYAGGLALVLAFLWLIATDEPPEDRSVDARDLARKHLRKR